MRRPTEIFDMVSRDLRELGVSGACRRHGLHRSTWYRHASPSPAHECRCDSHRDAEIEILELARSHPNWGCDRIAYCLQVCGIRLSSPTVQRILIRHGLGRRKEREAAALQARTDASGSETSPNSV